MNPIAFSLFGISIRWYGILIATGMFIGVLVAMYNCRRKDISFDIFTDMLLIVLPCAIIGARLYYVIFEFDYYRDNLFSIFNIREGGLAIHGGVIFGVIVAFIYLRKKNQDFLRFADVAAPSLILAQAVGRWGNFFNQEAHGGPVSREFIMRFPEFIQRGMYIDGTYYHPTFLYESLWNLSVFVILLIILYKSSKKGVTFFSYLGLYSLGRFFIEGLRTDSLMLGPLRAAQLVSLAGVAIWIGYLLIINRGKRT